MLDRCVDSTGRTAHTRHMLWAFVELLLGTGLRVSEAQWLQIGHLEFRSQTDRHKQSWHEGPETWEDANGLMGFKHSELPILDGAPASFRIRVASDNPGLKHADHARIVIPAHYYSEVLFHHLYYLSAKVDELTGTRTEDPLGLPPQQYLFINLDGSRTKSFANGFRSLMNAAKSARYPDGLLRYEGKARSLTSLRHTYASKQIEAGATANGLGFLADNMGTSAEMLRKHYGQVLHELKADDLQLY